MPAAVKINYWDSVIDGVRINGAPGSHFSLLIPAISGGVNLQAKPERYLSLYKGETGTIIMDLTASAD